MFRNRNGDLFFGLYSCVFGPLRIKLSFPWYEGTLKKGSTHSQSRHETHASAALRPWKKPHRNHWLGGWLSPTGRCEGINLLLRTESSYDSCLPSRSFASLPTEVQVAPNVIKVTFKD